MSTDTSVPTMESNANLRQRKNVIQREIANPIRSISDIEIEFDSSKLGVRVRSNEAKTGLFVAAVTEEAPPIAKKNKDSLLGAQIVTVNDHQLDTMPFQQAVDLFAGLSLPITVKFRPATHRPVSQVSHSHQHEHHHHHHHHNSRDEEDDDSCYIGCYIFAFAVLFMFLCSVALNGMPSVPQSNPFSGLMSSSLNRRSKSSRNSAQFSDMARGSDGMTAEQMRGSVNKGGNQPLREGSPFLKTNSETKGQKPKRKRGSNRKLLNANDNSDDIIEQLSSSSSIQSRQRINQMPPIELKVGINLADIYLGTTLQVEHSGIQKICPVCNGLGALNGDISHTHSCDKCDGTGVIDVDTIATSFIPDLVSHQQCDICGGTGMIIDESCQICNGGGIITSYDDIFLDIPKAIHNGDSLILAGEGHQSLGMESGDIVAEIEILRDAIFERDADNGLDLHTTIGITSSEALLGFDRVISHLDKHAVTIHSSSLTNPDSVMTIANEGLESENGDRGDLIVHFNIGFPKQVNSQ